MIDFISLGAYAIVTALLVIVAYRVGLQQGKDHNR